jgi:hypothetical protein
MPRTTKTAAKAEPKAPAKGRTRTVKTLGLTADSKPAQVKERKAPALRKTLTRAEYDRILTVASKVDDKKKAWSQTTETTGIHHDLVYRVLSVNGIISSPPHVLERNEAYVNRLLTASGTKNTAPWKDDKPEPRTRVKKTAPAPEPKPQPEPEVEPEESVRVS